MPQSNYDDDDDDDDVVKVVDDRCYPKQQCRHVVRYTCPECGKVFGRSSHLSRHIKTHSNGDCNKQFARVDTLNEHIQRVHRDHRKRRSEPEESAETWKPRQQNGNNPSILYEFSSFVISHSTHHSHTTGLQYQSEYFQELLLCASKLKLIARVYISVPFVSSNAKKLPVDLLVRHLGDCLILGIEYDAVDLETCVEYLDIGVEVLVLSRKDLILALLERGVPSYRLKYHAQSLEDDMMAQVENILRYEKGIKEKVDLNGRKIFAFIENSENNDLPEKGHDFILTFASLDPAKVVPLLVNRTIDFLVTDRPDGLFPTIVANERNSVLGLVYSSRESIECAVMEEKGIYYSRSRKEIWEKGKTSGDTQVLKRIQVDCDSDALKFVVVQEGSGFCHLSQSSCFGGLNALENLESILISRRDNPMNGSYTSKLYENDELLNGKIREEAIELCEANSKNEIAWETADLIYFALAKCVKNGVSLFDVETHLNSRSRKVTRRPGLLKPQLIAPKVSLENEIDLRIFDNSTLSKVEYQRLQERPMQNTEDLAKIVLPIIKEVRKHGDAALFKFTKKFDNVEMKQHVFLSPFSELSSHLSPTVQMAIDQAYDNIFKFHEVQLPRGMQVTETSPGVTCMRFHKAIESVGLYVPGGSAVLPSTALMLGVPAKVAGCKTIVIACPPNANGTISPEIVYIANKIGATHILAAGGAQAVAAFAYGTESVPKVSKICGPGNQFVTAAKMIVQNDPSALVSIDMPAGPSEVLVIADETSRADFVASDLLSQAEHGADSHVVLVTVGLNESSIDEIRDEVKRQAQLLPRLKIIAACLSKSFILKCQTLEESMQFSNNYAPEHLILHVGNPKEALDLVENAGSVFLGQYTPESCGDYASGTNHTLPTFGYAKSYSGVSTNTFLKYITAQEITQAGLEHLGDTVATLAQIEELEAHRQAVLIRLKDITGQ